jgi:hypothetical protein
MSNKEDESFIIQEEPPQQCVMCGRIAELRPYGPNGECVCYECGMKDIDSAVMKFFERLIADE